MLRFMQTHRAEFTAILHEALDLQEQEDFALGTAMNEGRLNEYVSEEGILRILRSKAENS